MKKYKNFTFRLLILLICFVCFHFLMWQFTKKVYPNDYKVGDLARMSYKLDLITARNDIDTFNKKHINFNNYNQEKVDLITIGDSFSNGRGGGENRYYQDYIVNSYNLKVLNILKFDKSENYLDTIIMLINSGFIDKIKPKYIILESVQRNTYSNLGFNKLNLSSNIETNIYNEIKNKKDIFNSKEEKKYTNKIKFINNLNYNLLKYNLEFYINGYGKQKKYYIEKLTKNFFSSKTKNELIFVNADIDSLKYETKENLDKLNYNLNKVSKLLKNKNVTLYYMPVVDKYNLYHEYLLNKDEYPKSVFFEYLRTLQKNYKFIDTKKILSEELKKDKIDIFFSDDTHWTHKASEVIINKLNLN